MQGNNIRRAYSVERRAYSQNLNAKRYPLNAKTFWLLICSLVFCVLIFEICCFAEEQFVYNAKGKRDPFIPLVTPDGRLLKLEKEETASGLLLEGIIYDEHGLSYCLVNGEVVRVSDKIGDYQVLKIEKNKVIFIKGGQTLEVELKEEGP